MTRALQSQAAATYRQVDVAGRTATADSAGLVQLLYDELVAALRAAGFAAEQRQFAIRAERVTRATAILFALEHGLDFERGGDLSRTLATVYAGARARLVRAAMATVAVPFHALADELDEIAGAWRQVRAA